MLVVFLGLSGAGKSSTIRHLSNLYGMPVVSPIRMLKEVFEKVDPLLSVGDLETPDGKGVYLPTGSDGESTYSTLLVEMFHLFQRLYPSFGRYSLAYQLRQYDNEPVVLVDSIRERAELSLLLEQRNVLFFDIRREGAKALSSDKHYFSNLEYLKANDANVVTVYNNDTFQCLIDTVDEILNTHLFK